MNTNPILFILLLNTPTYKPDTEIFGDKILEIHHVGSTSIKGLMAKPIIDILIVLNSLDEISDVEEILKDYGYSNRGQQGVNDRYFFAKGSEESRTHYIHFVELNSDTYSYFCYNFKFVIRID